MTVTDPGALRVDKVVTSGTFSLDGGTWEVDNNVWLVGNDHDVIVIDAAHDAGAIVEAVGHRTVLAIALHARPRRPRRRGAFAGGADRGADPAAPR